MHLNSVHNPINNIDWIVNTSECCAYYQHKFSTLEYKWGGVITLLVHMTINFDTGLYWKLIGWSLSHGINKSTTLPLALHDIPNTDGFNWFKFSGMVCLTEKKRIALLHAYMTIRGCSHGNCQATASWHTFVRWILSNQIHNCWLKTIRSWVWLHENDQFVRNWKTSLWLIKIKSQESFF